jgi:gamma-glutamyltranspeptidase
MNHDPLYYPHSSRLSGVFAGRGMVAASQPLAAQAGLEVLRKGGNAVDAAVATAACLTVVEPTSNGMGGDAFALVWTGSTESFSRNSRRGRLQRNSPLWGGSPDRARSPRCLG